MTTTIASISTFDMGLAEKWLLFLPGVNPREDIAWANISERLIVEMKAGCKIPNKRFPFLRTDPAWKSIPRDI